MEPRIIPVPISRPSFLAAPRCEDLDTLSADLAIIAFPYTVPYSLEWSRQPSSLAPAAIREQSQTYVDFLKHYDFDYGGDIFAGKEVRMVDCGDVYERAGQYEENSRICTAVIRKILDRGAVPIILGGDHATTIPIMRGYEGRGSMCAVHLDAHLDWRDEVNGIHDGLSSPMRRASELPWVTSMFQVGLRGIGSARQKEVDDSGAWGSVRIRAEELRQLGVAEILKRVPEADQYYISLDTDVIDPAVAPGINALAFGGISYFEATNLLNGIAAKGKIVGFDIVEIAPYRDHQGVTSLLAARLIMNLLAAMTQTGQLGR
jgi:agmatinase